MRPDTTHTDAHSDAGEDDADSFLDRHPSKRIEAIPPNEVTAGVDVTVHDLDDADMPPMFGVHQYFPPEDDIEGESVYVHGEHAVAQVIRALSDALSGRFEEVPWDDE